MKYQLNDGRILDLDNELELVNSFPSFIEVQTNSYCNSRCIICPYTKIKSSVPMGKMEKKLWDKLVGEFYANRLKIKNVEPYLNNEPFLDRDIMTILYTLKSIGCYVEISTNLHNCTKELIDEIVANRLIDEMRCSIYGLNADTYKRITGIAIKDVLSKFKHLARANEKARFPIKVQLTMVEHSSLISDDELHEAKKLAAELNVIFKAYPYLDRAENNNIITPKIIADGKCRIMGCKLGYLKNRLAVWHDGIVALCCQDWARKHVIGDLKVQSIQNLWNSAKMKRYRHSIYSGGTEIKDLLCRKCALAIVEVKG